VAAEALRVMEVPKDIPEELPKTLVSKLEDLKDLADIDSAGDEPNILEDGDDDDSAPAVDPTLPKVPNFKGKTMRAVLAEAAAKGLTVLPDGSGVARMQIPAAGAVLRQGERIKVQFSR
jgi:cell division protein FtsI (penicillin-binding protein 3)